MSIKREAKIIAVSSDEVLNQAFAEGWRFDSWVPVIQHKTWPEALLFRWEDSAEVPADPAPPDGPRAPSAAAPQAPRDTAPEAPPGPKAMSIPPGYAEQKPESD